MEEVKLYKHISACCIFSRDLEETLPTDLNFSSPQKCVALFFRSWTSTPTTVLGGGLSSSSSGSLMGSRSGGKGEYSVLVRSTNWNETFFFSSTEMAFAS